MDKSEESKTRNADLIPCECGCGTLIKKYGSDHRVRRFDQGHQFKGNQFGQKDYDLATILEQAEPLRPFCACGCGEKLEVPKFMQKKGFGLQGIQSRWNKHPYQKGHGLWDLRTKKLTEQAQELSSEKLGLIYGTLLGDGSISYPNLHSRFPRLAWTHTDKQYDWIEYKAHQLSELRPKLQSRANQGYGNISIGCYTICHPQLRDVFNVVKPDGTTKTVSLNWLEKITSEGIVWWYLDDGSLRLSPQGSPSIQFHTEGYSAEENALIADWLTQKGYCATVKKYTRGRTGKTYDYISLRAESTRKFLDDFRTYSIPSMDYKFRKS
jgi:hypothetical protein